MGCIDQYQTGRKFLFEHPADASSWNTEMVSLVTGLKGVMLVTVDLCTLLMVDEDERSYYRTNTCDERPNSGRRLPSLPVCARP